MRISQCIATAAMWLILSLSISDAQQEHPRKSPANKLRGEATSPRDPWYFTVQEIDSAYKFQAHFGQRVPNAIHSLPCNLGRSEVSSYYQGKEVTVPCAFIRQITKQLRDLIERGSARYLFALDVDRAQLAVPLELWEKKYSKLDNNEALSDLLREPSLIALYHTAAHLRVTDGASEVVNSEAKAWRDKSNVIGYFNGSPLTVLPPDPSDLPHGDPDGYRTAATIYFQAHWLGESLITVNLRPEAIDLSFDPGLFAPGLFDAALVGASR